MFADDDVYSENYRRIATDHVSAMKQGVENPFMNADFWRESEDDTRRLVSQHSSPGEKVLDVGVGLGRLLEPFHELQRFGIDVGMDYLPYSRNAGIDAVFARVEDLPYRSEVFDLICCCDVLEHVLDFFGCTKEILRVLKKGGRLVGRVPFKEPLHSYMAEDAPYEFVHLRNFDLESLQLHFCKIFGCRWIQHEFTTFACLDADRLAIRLPQAGGEIKKTLHSIVDKRNTARTAWHRLSRRHEPDPLFRLRSLLSGTHEQLVEELSKLQHSHPEHFSKLIRQIVLPTEISFVIQK